MFESITCFDNLYEAYKLSLLGDTKYSVDAILFARNDIYNLYQLQQSLINGTYTFGAYHEFYVHEPKKRLVHAPEYKDKVVQLSIYLVLKDYFNPTFIYDSYGSIEDKGTHACVNQLTHFARKSQWEHGEDSYIVKADVEKFFYSIDREILKSIIAKKITCPQTLNLLFIIIDSADTISELGLPLGNTFSQIAANIYMNGLDQYMKRVLGVKYYIRYMDDMFIYARNKEEASYYLEEMRTFLINKLNLTLQVDKSDIFPSKQGINGIGFKIHPTHRLLRDQSKRNIKRKTKKFRSRLEDGRITPYKVEEILSSWQGHAEHGNSHNFINRLVERNEYMYKDNNNNLKVNTNEPQPYPNS